MKIIKAAVPRSSADSQELRATVARVIEKVRKEGDGALREYNMKFDGNDRENFRLT